jgi:hypothetical protein
MSYKIKYFLKNNNFQKSYFSKNRNIIYLTSNNLSEKRNISTYSNKQTVSTFNDTEKINLEKQKKKLDLDLSFENSQLVYYLLI